MPGSIQVSVLDIKELPSSSTSVKVSLGNVEYEAGGKGTFLFPLMNLRDNLILTVQDTEGNQVSHSGFRTMTIIEKGTWDDVFPVEGGGLVHMKLQFILSDEERNRIRLVRESAMKKKQAEILGSRLRNAGSVKSLESPLHRHENAADRSKETPFSRESEQKPNSSGNLVEESYKQNLEEKSPSDVKGASEQSTSTPLLQETKVDLNMNNEIPLQPAEEPKYPAKSIVVDNPVEKLDKQNLEEKSPIDVKQMSKLPPSQGTEVNTNNNNEIQLQLPHLPKILQDTSSRDVGSTSIAGKIKLFPPKLAGEPDKQGSADKTTRNIKKMISVFESSLSQDTVPVQPSSTKAYRVGTLRSLKDSNFKDYYEKLESSQERLKNSETSSSTRLRNSFSTGDLRKNLSSIIKGDEVGVDDNFVELNEMNLQSEGNDPKGMGKLQKQGLNNEEKIVLTEIKTKNLPKPPHEGVNNGKKFALTETKTRELPKSLEEDATITGRALSDNKESHTRDTEKENIDGRKFEEKGHQEKIFASIPEVVAKGEVQCESDGTVKQGEEMENSESACVKATNGSLGQAIKIALVVGFGVLVLLLRQREPGKGRKIENKHAIRNQVFMNKRGSIKEQHRIGVSRFS